jgi:hypothetical protein
MRAGPMFVARGSGLGPTAPARETGPARGAVSVVDDAYRTVSARSARIRALRAGPHAATRLAGVREPCHARRRALHARIPGCAALTRATQGRIVCSPDKAAGRIAAAWASHA